MNFIDLLVKDLRERRLWPVAVALLVALIAVPLLLSRSSSASSSSTGAVVPAPEVGGSDIFGRAPVLSRAPGSAHSALGGSGRDPFTQQYHAALAGVHVGAAASSPASGAGGSQASSGGGSSSALAASSGASSSSSSTTPITDPGGSGYSSASPPPAPAAPAPVAPRHGSGSLRPDQAYHVRVDFADTQGNVTPFDPMERLTPVPSNRQPLVVELGVLGGRVLFAVMPGTAVTGPGRCIRSPSDCEVISLGVGGGQIENLYTLTNGSLNEVGQFAVTGLSIDTFSSPAAALRARRAQSQVGHAALAASHESALAFFPFRPGLGTLVDRRS